MTRTLLISSLLVAMTMAGCVENGSDQAPIDGVDGAQGASHLLTGLDIARIEIEDGEPQAILASFDVGQGNQCAYVGYSEQNQSPDEMVAGRINSAIFATPRGGASIDDQSTSLPGQELWSFALSGNLVPESGIFEVLLFGRGSWNMFFGLNCTQPFDLVASQAAPLTALFSGLDMAGVGADAWMGGATIAGTRDVEAAGPARAWVATSEPGQGTWSISHDDGTWSTDWTGAFFAGDDEALYELSGPPGTWRFELTETHQFFNYAWAAVAEDLQDVNVLTSWS